jgi:hypothetical protein
VVHGVCEQYLEFMYLLVDTTMPRHLFSRQGQDIGEPSVIIRIHLSDNGVRHA